METIYNIGDTVKVKWDDEIEEVEIIEITIRSNNNKDCMYWIVDNQKRQHYIHHKEII